MKVYRKRKKPISRVRRLPGGSESEVFNTDLPVRSRLLPERLGVFYASGPVLELDKEAGNSMRSLPGINKSKERTESEDAYSATISSHGKGMPCHDSAASNSTRLRLTGRTDAQFDGGSYRTANTRVRQAKGCAGCEGNSCIRVTGTLIATYHVTTRVTLPRLSDYSELTPCQRTRVRHAIRTVLAPHEQQHVTAFRRYNGTTRMPFNLTLCRDTFDTTIESMFNSEERSRQAAAQAASDALDPFYFDVDIDCEDASDTGGGE